MAAALPVAISCLSSSKNRNYYSFKLDTSFENIGVQFDVTDSTVFAELFVPDGAPIGYFGKVSQDNGAFLGGFALCRGVDPVVENVHPVKTMLHCIAHPYYQEEKTFAVFRDGEEMPEYHIAMSLSNDESYVAPQSVLLNNTNAFVNQVRCGKGLDNSTMFQEGDWAAVTFTGFLKDAKTGEASLRMADFDAFRDSVVTTWTPLDLSPLGKVDRIEIALTSSRPGALKYVCLDHFYYDLHIEF